MVICPCCKSDKTRGGARKGYSVCDDCLYVFVAEDRENLFTGW